MCKKIRVWIFIVFLLETFFGGGNFSHATPLPKSQTIVLDGKNYTVSFTKNPHLLQEEMAYLWQLGDLKIPLEITEGKLLHHDLPLNITQEKTWTINKEAFGKWFNRVTGAEEEKNIKPVKITTNDKGWINFKGRPYGGVMVHYESLVPLMDELIKHPEEEIRIIRADFDHLLSPVEADEELKKRGIKEVVAIGESNFYGSSKERRQNIWVSTNIFNGTWIPKGSTFSFNTKLNNVDPSRGFVPELVIKGDTTEKEFGGGVCQVSTTIFRAAFNAGLPIPTRRNHSYAVPYYKPVGLDATIYLGGQDLEFINDTPTDILVQAVVEGSNLYFVFYGTKDDRKVKSFGPITSHYSAPPKPLILDTTEIPPGQTRQINGGIAGLRAEWIRTVEKDGEIEKDNWVSHYRPWPAKILRGAEKKKLAFVERDKNTAEKTEEDEKNAIENEHTTNKESKRPIRVFNRN